MIRDWMDIGPVGNNPFSNDRSTQTDGQRDTSRTAEEEGSTQFQTHNADSIPPVISLQGQQLGRLVTLDLKGNDIRVRLGVAFV